MTRSELKEREKRKMKISAHKSVTAATAAGLVLVLASIAWACTGVPMPQPVLVLQPSSGPTGTEASVEGRNMSPVNGQVEIRWNGTNGPVLARAMVGADNRFTTSIRIPDVTENVVYNVVALVNTNARAAAPFEVTPSPNTNTNTGNTGTGETGTGETSTVASGADPASGGPGGTNSIDTAGGVPEEQAPAPQESAPTAAQGGETSASSPVVRPASSVSRVAPSDVPSSANPPTVVSASGRALFGGSVAAQMPPTSSASGDLWSAFDKGRASFVAGIDEPAAGTGNPPSPAVVMGGAALAMMAILAGFAVAEMGRRRKVHSES